MHAKRDQSDISVVIVAVAMAGGLRKTIGSSRGIVYPALTVAVTAAGGPHEANGETWVSVP